MHAEVNSSPVDSLDRPVWGAAAIGQVVNRTTRQTFHLLAKGQIDATKVGDTWVSTPRRLLARIAGESKAAA